MYLRSCNILKTNSFILLGPRGTGKSTLIKHLLKGQEYIFFDLLESDTERLILKNPRIIIERWQLNKTEWIFIDEVQKIPALLDWIHKWIEEYKIKFALSGSSVRKLKRGSANLMAGRAFFYPLYPLTHIEIENDFNLQTAMEYGTLPKSLSFTTVDEKKLFLNSYANTYLKEEIQQEQLVRNYESFLRFLEVAAQCNSEILNYSKIGREAQVEPRTVERYFQLLSDTYLGFMLEPYVKSLRKRIKLHPKFYFFDLGIKRALDNMLDIPLRPQTSEYGKAFETFIILEIKRINDYFRKNYKLYFLTTEHSEINLIIERPGLKTLLIEIKSSTRVDETRINKLSQQLSAFKSSDNFELMIISQEQEARQVEKVKIYPWKIGIQKIFGDIF